MNNQNTDSICSQQGGRIMSSFSGVLNSEKIQQILHQIEVDFTEVDVKIRKKIYNIALEGLQNVFHHGLKTKQEEKGVVVHFTILHDGFNYQVVIGNFVDFLTKERIKERFSQLNKQSLVNLRKEYLHQLVYGSHSRFETPGLGLLEMAKKSKKNMSYQVREIDANTFFICVSIKVE